MMGRALHKLAIGGYWLVLTLLLTGVMVAALPQKVAAAGETFTQDGNTITGSGGVFEVAGLNSELGFPGPWVNYSVTTLSPASVTFVEDGDSYAGSQSVTLASSGGGGAVFCSINYTLTVANNDPASGTLTGESEGCPGQAVIGSIPATIDGGGASAAATEENDCISQTGTSGWLVCPIILTAADATQKLTEFIVDLLKLKTDEIFVDTETSSAYRTAWSAFRNIAYAFLVIFGLIMVASQVFSLDIFSAYSLRKMLPGLIIATIFVPLSWPAMEFLYTMSNDAADAVMEIIRTPFEQVGSVREAVEEAGRNASFNPADGLNEFGAAILRVLQLVGLGGAAVAAGATYVVLGGWGVVLALLASVALFIFSIFILLAARNVVATLLVIVAPIAIIMRAFEPLQKGFTFWWGAVVVIILTVPGVAAILTITGVAALIAAAAGGAINLITAFVILIAGIALVWTLFLQLDRITGYLGNVASRATGKAQEGLAGYRKNTIGRRRQEAIEGQRDMRVFGINRGPFNVGRTMRRAHLAGQAGKGGFVRTHNRARLAAAEQAMMQQSAKKRLEEEGGRMSGDDDAMALAMQRGMTRQRFTREYQQRTGRDGRQALADMEASFGAEIGTQAMRVAAARARWGSVSAYNDFDIDTPEGARNMYRQMMQDAGEIVDDGAMSVTDVVAAMKSNSQRADISGHSFPQMMAQVSQSAERLRQVRSGQTNVTGRVIDENNVVDPNNVQATGSSVRLNRDGQLVGQGPNLISDSEIDAWQRGALEYAQPGQLVAGRTETVRILGQHMRRRLQRSVAAQQQAETAAAAAPNDPGAQAALQRAERETKRQVAALAGRYQVMGQISPENARYMAQTVMEHDIDMGAAGRVNIQQLMERYQTDPEYQQYRYEFVNSSMAGAQAQQQAQAQAAATGQPPGQVQPPGQQQSDRWLKRDIHFVGTALQGSINLYRFKYLWDNKEYVGVMAQELLTSHPEAVLVGPDGYYQVDYDLLDIPFQTYQEWQLQAHSSSLTNPIKQY